jgi:hypothetical protein
MLITTTSPETIRERAANLVGRLRGLAVKKVSWTIYDDNDESNLVDVICTDSADRMERDIEDEAILWDISALFISETGMFEVDVDAGTIKRLGDAYLPTQLEYEYDDNPETLETDLSHILEKSGAQDNQPLD